MLRRLDDTRSFHAVILDMDGLMLDTEIIGLRAWKRAAADFGWSVSDEQYLQLIGQRKPDAWAALTSWWRDRPGDRGSLDAVAERAAGYARGETVAVKDGLLDLLDWAASERVPVAVGSSSSRETIIARLRQTGLSEAVGVVAGGDEVAHGKPAPDIFLLAARRLDCEPRSCVVIEDSDHGINGAHAAGMTPFLVPDSSIPRVVPPAVAAKAYLTCRSLLEVLDVLRSGKA